jgi:hypothetical protein
MVLVVVAQVVVEVTEGCMGWELVAKLLLAAVVAVVVVVAAVAAAVAAVAVVAVVAVHWRGQRIAYKKLH